MVEMENTLQQLKEEFQILKEVSLIGQLEAKIRTLQYHIGVLVDPRTRNSKVAKALGAKYLGDAEVAEACASHGMALTTPQEAKELKEFYVKRAANARAKASKTAKVASTTTPTTSAASLGATDTSTTLPSPLSI